MTTLDTDETSVTLRRTFDAPRECLFEAFTELEELEQWQPSGEFDVEAHAFEAEPGGDIAVTHINSEGRFDIEGTVEEVVENERLVHTWRLLDHSVDDSESNITDAETRITVEFRDVDENTREVDRGTEVVFTHEQLAPEMVEETAEGWEWILGRLETVTEE